MLNCPSGPNIRLAFSTYEVAQLFNLKDNSKVKSRIVYQFKCAGCTSTHGETTRHLTTRVEEHMRDHNSHIFRHLEVSGQCRDLCTENCFSVLDGADNTFILKLKESMHIKWQNP